MQANISHIRGSTIPLPKLSAADLDAQIASNRERFYDSVDPFDEFERWKERRAERQQQRRARPSLIPLDSSLRARLHRWVQAFLLDRRSPL